MNVHDPQNMKDDVSSIYNTSIYYVSVNISISIITLTYMVLKATFLYFPALHSSFLIISGFPLRSRHVLICLLANGFLGALAED